MKKTLRNIILTGALLLPSCTARDYSTTTTFPHPNVPEVKQSYDGTVDKEEPIKYLGNKFYGYIVPIKTEQGNIVKIPVCSTRKGINELEKLLEQGNSVRINLYRAGRKKAGHYKEWSVHSEDTALVTRRNY